MKICILLISCICIPIMANAQPSDEEIPVRFEGDEEVVVEGEVEVTFDDEEETDSTGLANSGLAPEHEYSAWLMVLPLLCLALLAMNVSWRTRSPEKSR